MMKKETKVAFILPENGLLVPAVQGGAIETLMTMLLEQNELERKFDFIMVSYNPEECETYYIDYKNGRCYYCHPKEKRRIKNIFWEKIQTKLGNCFPKLFPRVNEYYKEIYQILKKENPDYVISEGCMPEQFVIFLRKIKKERMVIHLHHHFPKKIKYDSIYGKTLAISQFIADEWNKTTPEKRKDTYVWRNCIEVEKFITRLTQEDRSCIRKSMGFTDDDFIVLFCGRIVEVKGVREVIQAITSIPDKKIKLLIIGSSDFARGNSGDYARYIDSCVKESSGRIKHLGYVKYEELYQYYQVADIQVVPSLWEEAAGLVVLEGMMSKLPLIITESGGMVEYVDRKYTQVVPKNQDLVKNLQERILLLRENKTMRNDMAEGAFQYAQKYTKECYFAEFCKIVEKWKRDEADK